MRNANRAIASKLLAFQYLSKVLSIQCGFETLSLKANFCSFLLLKETDGHMPEDGEILGGLTLANSARIFLESDI